MTSWASSRDSDYHIGGVPIRKTEFVVLILHRSTDRLRTFQTLTGGQGFFSTAILSRTDRHRGAARADIDISYLPDFEGGLRGRLSFTNHCHEVKWTDIPHLELGMIPIVIPIVIPIDHLLITTHLPALVFPPFTKWPESIIDLTHL